MKFEPQPSCVHEPEKFFPDHTSYPTILYAREICRKCTHRVKCRAEAESYPDTYGVWGGNYYQDGEVIPLAELHSYYEKRLAKQREKYRARKGR